MRRSTRKYGQHRQGLGDQEERLKAGFLAVIRRGCGRALAQLFDRHLDHFSVAPDADGQALASVSQWPPTSYRRLCLVLVINPGDRTTRRREIEIPDKNDDALRGSTAQPGPTKAMPARDEKQGANLCAIEIILQRIWNGWKASV